MADKRSLVVRNNRITWLGECKQVRWFSKSSARTCEYRWPVSIKEKSP